MLLVPLQLLDMGGGEPGGAAATFRPYDKLSIGLRISISSWVLASIISVMLRRMGLLI